MARTMTTNGGINKLVAMIAGSVLVLIGILGFVPGIVNANGYLLGMFAVNLTHNLVHLISGAVLLGAAYMNNGASARTTLLVVGAVYAVVAVVGFIAPGVTNSILAPNAAASITADNFLHLLLAVVFLAVPLAVKDEATRPYIGRPM